MWREIGRLFRTLWRETRRLHMLVILTSPDQRVLPCCYSPVCPSGRLWGFCVPLLCPTFMLRLMLPGDFMPSLFTMTAKRTGKGHRRSKSGSKHAQKSCISVSLCLYTIGECCNCEFLLRLFQLSNIVTHPYQSCLLYTSPSPRDDNRSRMPSSA